MSLLFLKLMSTHPNSPKSGHREHLHPHCFIKTIIRIIWKVAVKVICFTVSSDDLEISLAAVNLTTMTVAEWRAACGFHIHP